MLSFLLSSPLPFISFCFLFISPPLFSSFPLHFPSLVSPFCPFLFSFTLPVFNLSAPSLFFFLCFFLSSYFFFFLPSLFFFFFSSRNYLRDAPANSNSKGKKKQPSLQWAAPPRRGPQPGAPGACWGRCRPACPLAVQMGERLNLRPRRDGHLRSPPAPPPRPAGPPPAPPRLQRCRR